jgi:adenine-specific DNA-methyltransferase
MIINEHINKEERTQEHDIWEAMKQVDFLRDALRKEIDNKEKSAFGQFFTPYPVAELMSSMFTCQAPIVHILDAGAGIGSLLTAAVTDFCQKDHPPQHIMVTAYEIDDTLIEHLERAMYRCKEMCSEYRVTFTGIVKHEDFIESGATLLSKAKTLFSFDDEEPTLFDCVILNPPYKKIQHSWSERQILKEIGIEASNLYVAFLAIAMKLLAPSGELVAIIPRSFCNGPYFKKFRRDFLQTMVLQRIHIFESRTHVFSDDKVLQENIILHAIKTQEKPDQVLTTTSTGVEDDFLLVNKVNYDQVIHPNDAQSFIRIVQDDYSHHVVKLMSQFNTSLEDLGINISTGRVVDFRALDFLRMSPEVSTVPLLYPMHLQHGSVHWPISGSKKPNAIIDTHQTQSLLIPNEHYVLVKRFSSKEEKKRIIAVLYKPEQFSSSHVGFENHLNYFHQGGKGLNSLLAKGLVTYLNSTIVDCYFRQFNGHTQVNATDLRNIKYPTRSQLETLGSKTPVQPLSQIELDKLIKKELFNMPENGTEEVQTNNPIQVKQKIEEALTIIKDLGFLRAQQNERSALTILALLDLKPDISWSQAKNPLRGITPMMDFFREHYGKDYKPNTRETVRRQTVHQFLEAGLIEANPDQPDRPINSPKAVYQVEQGALELLRTFGTPEWDQNLRAYLASVESLQKRYAKEREMRRIPVTVAPGQIITLSPGGQNILVEKIIHEFAETYTPGGQVLYVGDTDEKFAYFDREGLEELGVNLEAHGKMPDVIIHYTENDWLILIEAVTSHGPIDGKRKDELERLFDSSRAGLVLVTAFLSRITMLQFMKDIAWETEVWIAEFPTHLIHFNGKRFLGPYEKKQNTIIR